MKGGDLMVTTLALMTLITCLVISTLIKQSKRIAH